MKKEKLRKKYYEAMGRKMEDVSSIPPFSDYAEYLENIFPENCVIWHRLSEEKPKEDKEYWVTFVWDGINETGKDTWWGRFSWYGRDVVAWAEIEYPEPMTVEQLKGKP
jgi:hypothetical protein